MKAPPKHLYYANLSYNLRNSEFKTLSIKIQKLSNLMIYVRSHNISTQFENRGLHVFPQQKFKTHRATLNPSS